MRNIVQPLPSMHCQHCNGELLFKRVQPDHPAFEIEVQIFVCAKCGREGSRRLIHDRYSAHTARSAEPKGDLARSPG